MPAWLVPVGIAAGQWLANRFTGGGGDGSGDSNNLSGKPGFDWKDLIIPGAAGAAGYFAGRAGGGDKSPTEVPFLNQLTKSSDAARAQGAEFQTMSTGALAPVLDYFRKLAGGDPAALMDATRQDRGRVLDQYDTARRAIANFGPRGGGTTSVLAESQFKQAESLADITSAARRDAAGQLGEIGPQLAALGLTSQQLASQDLNSIIQAVLTREGYDVQKRGQNLEALTGLGEALGTILGTVLTRDKGDKKTSAGAA